MARIAFVTPQFPVELETQGGLSNYLGRITRVLVNLGCEVEIFTLTSNQLRVTDFWGARVHHVLADRAYLWQRALELPGKLMPWLCTKHIFNVYRQAWALAEALERRHQERPFDVVQSCDYRLAGMFIPSRPGRTHVVRCSLASELYARAEGKDCRLDHRWLATRERRWLRSVDRIYAPSRYVADYRSRQLGNPVAVLRPPVYLESAPVPLASHNLPERYLFHFGVIGRRKGSDILADALWKAWQQEPELTMVWAGTMACGRKFFQAYPNLAHCPERVIWLGALPKPQLYHVLQNAAAVVALSRTDNLPNNVLESLACGVPVIGTHGASLDELIVPRENGELLPLNDLSAIADSLLKAWRGEPPFDGRHVTASPLADELVPETAAYNFLRYVDVEGQS